MFKVKTDLVTGRVELYIRDFVDDRQAPKIRAEVDRAVKTLLMHSAQVDVLAMFEDGGPSSQGFIENWTPFVEQLRGKIRRSAGVTQSALIAIQLKRLGAGDPNFRVFLSRADA